MDVRAQRLERRDVHDADFVRERTAQALDEQLVEAGEKCRERFAGAGRRGDERVMPSLNLAPAALLCDRRRAKRLRKPPCYDRVKGRNITSLHRPTRVKDESSTGRHESTTDRCATSRTECSCQLGRYMKSASCP